MTREKKAAAAAAGVLLASALTVGTVSGPTNNTNDSSFAGSITAIEEAVDNLVDKSVERGMDIEPPSESYTPGINGVIDGLDGMSPTSGTTRQVKVSKEGSLYRGDRVRVCQEFTAADQLRFAMGDVTIIATARGAVGAMGDNTIDQTTRIIILFGQNGQTKLKTVDMGDEMSMGNTIVIVDDEELTAASIAVDHHNRCYIAYNQDGDGVLTAVKCGKNRLNEVLWTDLWMDGGDPENICLAVEPKDNEAAVCCTRLPAGATQASAREAVLLDMALPPDGTEITNLGEEIVLTAAAQPALHGIDYSKDAYAKGWDMEYVHFWYDELGDQVRCNSIFITYPTSDEYRRGIIHIRRDRESVYTGTPKGPSTVMGYQMSQVYGSLPCADMERVCTGSAMGHMAGVALCHGVTKQFGGPNGSSVTKSRVELELYTVTRDEDKPFCLWWRVSDNWYGTNISNVSVGNLKDGLLYFSFARGNNVYAALSELRPGDSVQGPLVNVGAFKTFAAVEMVDATRAVLIHDTNAGEGYVRVLQADRVIAETDGYHFDGTILEDGSTGDLIRADITYWPDSQGEEESQ